MLPNDPIMLLSVVNTKLRDKYSSFEQLCEDLQVNQDTIISKLKSVGYEYSEELNKFM